MRRNLTGRVSRKPWIAALLVALISLMTGPVAGSSGEGLPAYHAVMLGGDGKADTPSLDRLVASLRRETPGERTPIVVLIHGFRLSRGRGIEYYSGSLVLDEGNVPTRHRLPLYYNDRRLRALASSLLFLQQPEAPAARESRLAASQAVLAADPETLVACAIGADAGIRVYATWLLRLDAGELEHVRIVRAKGAAAVSVRQAIVKP